MLAHTSPNQLAAIKAEAAINEFGRLPLSQSQNRASPHVVRKRNPSMEQLPKNKIVSLDLSICQVHRLPLQSSFNGRVRILNDSGAIPSASRPQGHFVNPLVYRDRDVEQLSEKELGITDPECARMRQELIAARYKKLNEHIKTPEVGCSSLSVESLPLEISSVPYSSKIKLAELTDGPENQTKSKSVFTPRPVIHVLYLRSATSANLSQGLMLQRGTPIKTAFDDQKTLTVPNLPETDKDTGTTQAQNLRAARNSVAHTDQETYLQHALVDSAGTTKEDTSRGNVPENFDPAL